MTARVHLLCAPFPSPQGTQGAVAAMLGAEQRAGIDSRLVTYAESYGASYGEPQSAVNVERLPHLPIRVGARSGPSFARVAHDVAALAWLARTRTAVFAHNVEAAWAAAAARVPYVYVAHTSMRAELPSYGGLFADAERFGEVLDRVAVTRAVATVAITPALADELRDRYGGTRGHLTHVTYAPLPWSATRDSVSSDTRAAWRRSFDIPPTACVVLHAGNLDAYQGIDTLLDVVAVMARKTPALLLVATESQPSEFLLRCAEAGVEVRLARLRNEHDRHVAHAMADVAIVARSVGLGLPIKLLDALARGLPVVATRMSCAGLPVHEALRVVPNSDAESLARVALSFSGPSGEADSARDRVGAAAPTHAYLREHHADAHYLSALRDAASRLEIAARSTSRA